MNQKLFDEFRSKTKVRILAAMGKFSELGLPFPSLEFSDSQISERIQRLGIEARYFSANQIDDLRAIAIETLRDDVAKYADRDIRRSIPK